MTVDWEAVRQMGARIRAQEVWLASPEGASAMEPFDRIARLESGNAKLRRKIEKRRERMSAYNEQLRAQHG